MAIIFFIIFAISINTLLGLGIFLRNQKSIANRFYAAQILFVNIWIIANFLENEATLLSISGMIWALRLDFAFAILFFYAWFRFCLAFVDFQIESIIHRTLNIVTVLIGIMLIFLSLFSSLIIKNISFIDGVIQFQEGAAWWLYALFQVALAFGGVIVLLLARKRFLKENLRLRVSQVQVILIGFISSIGFALFINLFLQTFFPISLDVSRLGIFGMTFLTSSIAYAVVKTQFLDVRLFVARAVAFSLLVTLAAVIYASMLTIIGNTLFELNIPTSVSIFGIIFAVITAITFPWLLHIITRITDKILFKHRYDSSILLQTLSRFMSQTLELEEMKKGLSDILLKEMRIESVLIESDSTSKNFLLYKKFFPKSVWSNWKAIVYDQLDDGSRKRLMLKDEIHVILPLIVDDVFGGLILLGSKSSGEMYFQRDLDVLNIFAHEAAVAINNATSYVRIKQFNQELEGIVKKRTFELQKSHKREIEKNKEVLKLKDEFVFIAAHELKAPVFAIKGFIQLVEMENKRLSKDSKEYVRNIHDASEHLNKLVNDLLEVARGEAGTLSVEVVPIDILPVIEGILREQTVLATERKISISLDVQDHSLILADSNKLTEVMTNLVNNAIKYNRDGGRVAINVNRKSAHLIINVEDTGLGIPMDQQAKIFGKFFRASGKATEGVLGTGLGLFITKTLVEKMGGDIVFSSKEGKGTIFTIQFPLAETRKRNKKK